ncbi:hypothetical protein EC843_1195 [Buttiauxella sp. JUb87]|nr:hypothetical protein EC843_1195 [Buttiauxella sp. JUb87]
MAAYIALRFSEVVESRFSALLPVISDIETETSNQPFPLKLTIISGILLRYEALRFNDTTTTLIKEQERWVVILPINSKRTQKAVLTKTVIQLTERLAAPAYRPVINQVEREVKAATTRFAYSEQGALHPAHDLSRRTGMMSSQTNHSLCIVGKAILRFCPQPYTEYARTGHWFRGLHVRLYQLLMPRLRFIFSRSQLPFSFGLSLNYH